MTNDELPLEIRTMIDMVLSSLADTNGESLGPPELEAYRTSMLEIAIKAYTSGAAWRDVDRAALEAARMNAIGAKEEMRQAAISAVRHAQDMINWLRETAGNALNTATDNLTHKEAELRRR